MTVTHLTPDQLSALEQDVQKAEGAPPAKAPIQLTADQASAFEHVKAFLHSGESMLVLGGHAGTGKTTMLRFVAEEALKLWGRGSVILTAPTNKAAKVLRGVATDADLAVRCFTIHKANGLRLADDDEKKYLVQEGEGEMQGVELVVVDEASMVGTRMFGMIENAIAHAGVKVLFCGDPYQLPPVNDGKMQAFERVREVRLQQIVRQAEGHPVIELGNFFRQRIDGDRPMQPPGGDGILYMRSRAWHDRLISTMKANALERPGEIRALAFTNRTVDMLATQIRKALYGEDVGRFVAGERVFTAAPYQGMHTDQEATILEVDELERHQFYPKFMVIPLQAETAGGARFIAYAPADPGKVDAERRRLADIAKRAKEAGRNAGQLWKAMHVFAGSFADFRSVHAMTVHRSQGSTFDSVFVDAADIKNAERHSGSIFKFRLLYVACSRARNRVFIRE